MAVAKKYRLNEIQRAKIREKRKEQKISAETLSERINKSKAWIGQIERGRLSTIKEDDLINLLSVLYEMPTKAINKDFLNAFLNEDINILDNASWFDNEYFDLWKYCKNYNFDSLIRKSFKTIEHKLTILCKEPNKAKEKFIIWKTLNELIKNLEHSPDLVSLINCLKFYALDTASSEYKNSIYNRILDLYNELNSYYERNESSCIRYGYSSDNGDFSCIYTSIMEIIQDIAVANQILFNIISENKNVVKLIEDYNKLINSINNVCKTYYFSKIVLDELILNDTLIIDIIEKHLPKLQLLLKEINESKTDIEFKIEAKID